MTPCPILVLAMNKHLKCLTLNIIWTTCHELGGSVGKRTLAAALEFYRGVLVLFELPSSDQ